MITSIVLIIVAIIALLIYVSAVIRKRPKHPNRISAHTDSPQQGKNGLVVTTPIDESLTPKGNPRNANALESITKEKTIVPGLETKTTSTTSKSSSLLNHQTDSTNFDNNSFIASDSITPDPFRKETVANRSTHSNTSTVSGSNFNHTHQPTHLFAHKSAKPTVATSNPFADANSALQIDPSVNTKARAEMSSEPRTPFLSTPNFEYSNSAQESASSHKADTKLDSFDYLDMTQVNLTTPQDVLDANPSLKAYETNTNWGQATKTAQQTYRNSRHNSNNSLARETVDTHDHTQANDNTNAHTQTKAHSQYPYASKNSATTVKSQQFDANLGVDQDLDLALDEDYSYNPHGNDSRKSYFSQVKTIEGTADPKQVESFDFDHKASYEQLISQTLPEDKIDDRWLSDYHFANSEHSLERPPEQELSLEQERELARSHTPKTRRPVAPEPNTATNEEENYDDLMRQLEQELNSFGANSSSNSSRKIHHRVASDVDYSGVSPLEASINSSVNNSEHQSARTNVHTSTHISSHSSSHTSINPQVALEQTLKDFKQQLASDPQTLALLLSQLDTNSNSQASNTVVGNNQGNNNQVNNNQGSASHTNSGFTVNTSPVTSDSNTGSRTANDSINFSSYNPNSSNRRTDSHLATDTDRNNEPSQDHSHSHSHTLNDFKLPSLEEELEFSTSTDLENLSVIDDLPIINDNESFEEMVTKSIISSKPDPHVAFFEEEAGIVNLFHNLKKGQSIDNYLIFKLFPMRSKVFSHDSIINFLRRHDSEFTLNNTNKSFLSYYDYYTSDSEKKKLVLYEIFTDKGPFSTDYSEYSYLLVLIDKRIFANSNDNFLSILLSRLHAMTVDLKGDLYWREQQLKKDSVSYSTGQFRKYIAQLTADPMLEEFVY